MKDILMATIPADTLATDTAVPAFAETAAKPDASGAHAVYTCTARFIASTIAGGGAALVGGIPLWAGLLAGLCLPAFVRLGYKMVQHNPDLVQSKNAHNWGAVVTAAMLAAPALIR